MKIFLGSFILFIILFSCQESKRSDIKNQQKNIIDTSGLRLYNPFNITAPLKKTYITSYINASCPSCINELNLWAEFQKEIKRRNNSDSTVFIPILFSKDDFIFIQHLFSSGKINAMPFYFLLDEKNRFLERNNFLKNNSDFHNTVVIDSDDEVIYGGNPITDKKSREKILET